MGNSIRTETHAIIMGELYNNSSTGKAALASVRSTASLASPRARLVWPLLLSHLDKTQLSYDGQPTRDEIAVYAAIRLYAIHQQGVTGLVYGPIIYNDSVNSDMAGHPLLQVLGNLRSKKDGKEALDRHVEALLGTTTITSTIINLTHLVSILKTKSNKSQKIDYAQLAQELYWAQYDYQSANRVRLRWGEQYYGAPMNTDNSEGKN